MQWVAPTGKDTGADTLEKRLWDAADQFRANSSLSAAGEEVSDEDFKTQLIALNEELETLNTAARKLEKTIAANVAEILAV